MPRKVSKKAGYSQAQKLAYYKAKAARQYVGKGAYKPAPKSRAVGQSMGEAVGSAFGFLPGVGKLAAPLASNLIGKLGGYLGNKLGSYMGWGAYNVRRNSLAVPEGNSPAAMHSQGMTTRICHREYFGDVITSGTAGAFNNISYKLQPGAPDMFPWLSDIAPNFQKYRVLGAIVEFKSGSGDAITGTNTALGEVLISSNYNCADPNFASRNQMENTQYCSSAKPSVSFVHVIECDPDLQAQENLYTSTSTTPITGLSQNDINWVNVQVATIGMQGTSVNVGSLYITYDIELIQPIEMSSIRRPYTDLFTGTTGWTDALPLLNATRDADSSLGGTVNANSQYTFPRWVNDGIWMIYGYWQSTLNVAYTPPVVSVSGGALISILQNDSVSQLQSPPTGIAATRFTLLSMIRVTSSPCVVTVSAGIMIGGGAALNSTFIVNALDASFAPMLAAPTPSPKMQICDVHTPQLHTRDTIREEYHAAMKDCEDAGESEIIERLKRKLAELENKSPALAYQIDRLNKQ